MWDSIHQLIKWFNFQLLFHILQSLLTDEQLANCPVLILGNKIDRPGAAGEDEIRSYFGLHGQTTGKVLLIRLSIH
jgi:hypothetical protein